MGVRKRRIRYFETADAVTDSKVQGSFAVVADVLRATSTITTALWNGCKAVIPVKHVQEAWDTASELTPHSFLLGGEREGKPIPGFHFGNSPQEYVRDVVRDKILITTTTNGTKALVHAATAERVVVLSFLNMSAVAQAVLDSDLDVAAIAAGIYGKFSIEDSMCVGFLIRHLLETAPQQFYVEPEAEQIAEQAEHYQDRVFDLLQSSPHGDFLRKLDFGSDLAFCAQIDSCPVVPIYRQGRITLNSDGS